MLDTHALTRTVASLGVGLERCPCWSSSCSSPFNTPMHMSSSSFLMPLGLSIPFQNSTHKLSGSFTARGFPATSLTCTVKIINVMWKYSCGGCCFSPVVEKADPHELLHLFMAMVGLREHACACLRAGCGPASCPWAGRCTCASTDGSGQGCMWEAQCVEEQPETDIPELTVQGFYACILKKEKWILLCTFLKYAGVYWKDDVVISLSLKILGKTFWFW